MARPTPRLTETCFLAVAGLTIYAVSIIFGRIYCGMHSTMDCIAGSIMGWACWQAWELAAPAVEGWVERGHWTGRNLNMLNVSHRSYSYISISVPLISVVVCLTLVHKHPEPVDDCPCFEDAIAILSVILGSFLCHSHTAKYGSTATFGHSKSQLRFNEMQYPWSVIATVVLALLKITLGIAIIFTWRIVCKKVMRIVLPKVFRAFAKTFGVDLPTRKHYKAATDYQDVPETHGIAAMPSFVDIPSEAVVASALPSRTRRYLHMRGPGNSTNDADEKVMGYQEEHPEVFDDEHYDIDGKHAQTVILFMLNALANISLARNQYSQKCLCIPELACWRLR
ncbi:hypothetical protein QFC20_003253 [Naganishia adeliensis]|uniref:Uncharacterized protein n=1 Tax=Naganishia adeliensis TaxID=92952 RepID=A0ACC2WCN2_9TREE|nr:hypothetical protein QFC20_003253 [Naganishia adeliensis]